MKNLTTDKAPVSIFQMERLLQKEYDLLCRFDSKLGKIDSSYVSIFMRDGQLTFDRHIIEKALTRVRLIGNQPGKALVVYSIPLFQQNQDFEEKEKKANSFINDPESYSHNDKWYLKTVFLGQWMGEVAFLLETVMKSILQIEHDVLASTEAKKSIKAIDEKLYFLERKAISNPKLSLIEGHFDKIEKEGLLLLRAKLGKEVIEGGVLKSDSKELPYWKRNWKPISAIIGIFITIIGFSSDILSLWDRFFDSSRHKTHSDIMWDVALGTTFGFMNDKFGFPKNKTTEKRKNLTFTICSWKLEDITIDAIVLKDNIVSIRYTVMDEKINFDIPFGGMHIFKNRDDTFSSIPLGKLLFKDLEDFMFLAPQRDCAGIRAYLEDD